MKYIISILIAFLPIVFYGQASQTFNCPTICAGVVTGSFTCEFEADVFNYTVQIDPPGPPIVINSVTGEWTVDFTGFGGGNSSFPSTAEQYTVTVICECPDGCDNAADFVFFVEAFPEATKVEPVTDACNGTLGEICFDFVDQPGRANIQFSLDGGVTYQPVVGNGSGQVCYQVPEGSYNVWASWGAEECPIEVGTCVVDNKNPVVTGVCAQ